MTRFSYETKSLDPLPDEDTLDRAGIGVDDTLVELTTKTGAALAKSQADYKRLEKTLERLESKMGRPGAGGDFSFANDNKADLATEKKNVNSYVRGDFKSLTVGFDPQAGYFVPDILQPTDIVKLYDAPTLLSLVRTEQWDGPGSDWMEPLRRALLTARRRGSETEAAQDTGTTNPVGLLTVPAGEAEASVTLSQMLIDDSARDLSVMVVSDMNAAFDRQIDAEIVSGTGTGNQASGFLSGTIVTTSDTTRPWGHVQYTPSGNAALITADSLFDLMYSLRAPYRNGAAWVMASSTALAVDKLKDGNGDLLWRNSYQAGQPASLLGYPVYFDENMPVIGANTMPLAFANWKLAYVCAKKNQMRLIRDMYTAKPSVVLYGYKRQGGGIANSEALKIMKIATA
jgi:HK97 family phage major capsid protein